MPIQRCQKDGERGWRWGQEGKCYTGPGALDKARAQGKAALVAQQRRGKSVDFERELRVIR